VDASTLPVAAATPPFPRAVLPCYRGRGISSIPASILEFFGGRLEGHPPLDADLLPPGFLDGVKTVVFMLVDGLGYSLLERAVRSQPRLELGRLMREGLYGRLTSVLPSTTTTALATLATGLTPQEHGLIGYKLFLREVNEIANMIRFSPVARLAPFPRKKLNPQAFFDHATIFQALLDLGVTSRVVIRSQYAHSALSKMFYRGAEVVGHAGTHDAFAVLRRMLEQRDGSGSFIYFYWDPIDTVSHHNGPNSEEVMAEIMGLDYAIRTHVLERFRGGDVALFITADHGHVHTPPARRMAFNNVPDLLNLLQRPPSGDSRLPYVLSKEGRREEVLGMINERFPEVLRATPYEEVISANWFGIGEPHPELPHRVGDLVVSVADDWKISYRYSTEEIESIGCHGGTDPEEMYVPFIGVRI